jgi:dTDP-4-amino-4,6-dideoxygalactose transaminase
LSRPAIPQDYYYVEELTDRRMSWVTRLLTRGINVDQIVQRRRNNYRILDTLIKNADGMERLFTELPKGVCPLYYPVKITQRDGVAGILLSRGIRAISWWKGYHAGFPWEEFPEACHLKDSVLALPVHQDLAEEQVLYIGRQLLQVVDRPEGGQGQLGRRQGSSQC